MTPYIPVLLGTCREARRSLKVAKWVLDHLQQIDSIKTDLIDLAAYQLPILTVRYEHMEVPPEPLQQFVDQLRQADGILIVAPEYKGSYPGSLKNALDYIPSQGWRHKAIGICTVSASEFGGVNCLAQLRLLSLALGGVPIPDSLPVSNVRDAFDEQGMIQSESLKTELDEFTSSLIWYTEALASQRHRENSGQ